MKFKKGRLGASPSKKTLCTCYYPYKKFGTLKSECFYGLGTGLLLPEAVLISWNDGGWPYLLVVPLLDTMLMLSRPDLWLRIVFLMMLSDHLQILYQYSCDFNWSTISRCPLTICFFCYQLYRYLSYWVVWWYVSFSYNCRNSASCCLFHFSSWFSFPGSFVPPQKFLLYFLH